MRNARLAAKRLRDVRLSAVLLIVEKLLIGCLIAVLTLQVSLVVKGIGQIREIERTSVYVNQDSTSDEAIAKLSEDPGSVARMRQLLDYVKEETRSYSYWEYEAGTLDDGLPYYQATTDAYFFDLYALDLSDGNAQSLRSFRGEDSVPVVVGAALQARFPFGSTWSDVDPNNGTQTTFEVVGALSPNQVIPNFFDPSRGMSTDRTYFRLVDEKDLREFAHLGMALGSLVVYSEDAKVLEDIEVKSEELKLFEMTFRSVDELLSEYIAQARYAFNVRGILLLVLAVAVIVTIMASLGAMVRREARSYALKIAVGATPFALFKEVFAFFGLLTLLTVPLIFLFSVVSLDAIFPAFVAIVGIFILDAIALAVAVFRIRSAGLIQAIRTGEA